MGSRSELITPNLSSMPFLSSVVTLEPQLRGLWMMRKASPSAPHESVPIRNCRSFAGRADALLVFTPFRVSPLIDLALCFHRASSHGLFNLMNRPNLNRRRETVHPPECRLSRVSKTTRVMPSQIHLPASEPSEPRQHNPLEVSDPHSTSCTTRSKLRLVPGTPRHTHRGECDKNVTTC